MALSVEPAMPRSVLRCSEAAHVIMTRVAKWSKLKAWAMTVAKRRGAKRAKVALARKLGIILHRMWVDATDFRFGQQAQA